MRRMNSLGHRGLVAAMEEEELRREAERAEQVEAAVDAAANPEAEGAEVVETEPVIVDDLGAGAETVETDLQEVNDEEAEQEEQQADIDEAVETAEALESICVALEACAGAGGLTKETAHVVGIAMDHMYKRVGLKTGHSMPALECFGGVSGRIGATQIALEEAESNIAKIWQAIWEAVQKAIAWFLERLTKIFGAAEKLEKRASALVARAKATKGSPKENSFESERLVHALNMNGKIPDVRKEAENLKAAAGDALENEAPRCRAIQKALETNDLKEIVAALSNPGAEMKHLKFQRLHNPEQDGFGEVKETTDLWVSQMMPGGLCVAIHAPQVHGKSPEEAARNMSDYHAGISPRFPKQGAVTEKVLPTLNQSAALAVAQAVADLAVEIKRFRGNLNEVKSMGAKISEDIKKKASEMSQGGEENSEGAVLMKLGHSVPKLLTQPGASFMVYAINTGKAMLDYVELSLKQFNDTPALANAEGAAE